MKKFLVDNAETMEDYWFEAQYLLETLVMKAKGQDKNGMDLSFTQVRAPLAGRTGQALVSVGDYVAAGPAPTLLTTVESVDPVT